MPIHQSAFVWLCVFVFMGLFLCFYLLACVCVCVRCSFVQILIKFGHIKRSMDPKPAEWTHRNKNKYLMWKKLFCLIFGSILEIRTIIVIFECYRYYYFDLSFPDHLQVSVILLETEYLVCVDAVSVMSFLVLYWTKLIFFL